MNPLREWRRGRERAAERWRQIRADLRGLRRLRPYLLVRWRLVALAFVVGALTSSLTVAVPWLVRYVMDEMIPTRSFETLPHWGIVAMSVSLGVAVIGLAQRYFIAADTLRLRNSLELALLGSILGTRLEESEKRSSAYWQSRVRQDVGALSAFYTTNLVPHVFTVLRSLVYVGMLVWISWKLSAVLAVALPLAALGTIVTSRRRRELNATLAEISAANAADVVDILDNLPLVKRTASESREELRINQRFALAAEVTMRLERLRVLVSGWLLLSRTALPVLVQLYALFMVARGQASMGDVAAFLLYAGLLRSSALGLVRTTSAFDTAFASAERVIAILDLPPETCGVAPVRSLPPRIRSIRFEAVAYSPQAASELGDDAAARPAELPVLRRVDLEIEADRPVALVGRSGSGKSTLIALLCGFVTPTSGRILVDGIDLRELDLHQFRRRLGVVSHDDYLLARSLDDNLGYRIGDSVDGKRVLHELVDWLGLNVLVDRDVRDRKRAARRAAEPTRIALLAEYAGRLEPPRKWRVSAGERQRMALIRELAHDPQVLVLDEANANLDGALEARLMDRVLERSGGIVLVISHRRSCIERMPRVCLLQDGEITAQGTHDELLATCPEYQRMFDPQSNPDRAFDVPDEVDAGAVR